MKKQSRRTATETEAGFLSAVLQLARLHGWRSFHQRPLWARGGKMISAVQGDGVGFPDLVLVRGPVLIFAELKVGRNRPTAEQRAWLDALAAAGVRAAVWTPDDWAEIETTLGAA